MVEENLEICPAEMAENSPKSTLDNRNLSPWLKKILKGVHFQLRERKWLFPSTFFSTFSSQVHSSTCQYIPVRVATLVYFGPFWDRLDRIVDRTRIFQK